jgi:hypothetical protein
LKSILVETVGIAGNTLSQVNWLKVGVAAVSGAFAAIPGLGFIAAGLISGLSSAAMTALDGGSLKDCLISFATGAIIGIVTHGISKAVSGKLNKIQCFVAGTGVLLASGAVIAIEDIRVGDYVKSYNETTGEIENKIVLQTFINTTYELTTIYTSDGQKIVSTPGHKFFANGQWISAGDLKAGDILVNVNGEKVILGN